MTVTVEARPGKARERTCIGCRKRSGPADLLRMTVSGGLVLPDPAHRAPGRGAHLHPVAECLDLAERRKAFPRAFRVPGPLELKLVRDHVAQCTEDSKAVEVTKAANRPPATTVATT